VTSNSNRILTIIKWLWFLIVLLGAGYYISTNLEPVIEWVNKIQAHKIIISFLLLIIWKFLFAKFMRLTLVENEIQISYIDFVKIISATEIGKYIPGGIWHFFGRYSIYRQRSMTNKNIIYSIISENFWLLSSSISFGGAISIYLASNQICEIFQISNSQIFIILVIGVWLAIWISVATILTQKINSSKSQHLIYSLSLILLSISSWLLLGISFSVLFIKIDTISLVKLIGGYSLGWAAGYVSIFAPAGIGVREAIISLVASGRVNAENIILTASAHRMILLLVEMLFWITFGFRIKFDPIEKG